MCVCVCVCVCVAVPCIILDCHAHTENSGFNHVTLQLLLHLYQCNVSDATVVYLASLCFEDEFLAAVSTRLVHAAPQLTYARKCAEGVSVFVCLCLCVCVSVCVRRQGSGS